MHVAPTPKSPPTRRERRKAQTRDRLVASARERFAEQGVEATRINEITEAADVGFGSFYNHFTGKDDIVAAVAEEVITELGEQIARATEHLPDPAEVVATAHRAVLLTAASDPTLGWLLIRLELSHDLASRALGPFAMRDLQAGIDAGRFHIEDPVTTLIGSGAALLGIVRSVLDRRLTVSPEQAAQLHAANVLRMLGVPHDEASAIAHRPLAQHTPTGTGTEAADDRSRSAGFPAGARRRAP